MILNLSNKMYYLFGFASFNCCGATHPESMVLESSLGSPVQSVMFICCHCPQKFSKPWLLPLLQRLGFLHSPHGTIGHFFSVNLAFYISYIVYVKFTGGV